MPKVLREGCTGSRLPLPDVACEPVGTVVNALTGLQAEATVA